MQLINATESLLLVIDIQEKLLPSIHAHEEMIKHCQWLLRLANTMQVPVFFSEQYPQGLGPTPKSLTEIIPTSDILPKVEFSCAANPLMLTAIEQFNRQHIVICGIETHVCVLQTAIDLANLGKQIFVVADATSTRYQEDKYWAIERMNRHNNIQIVTREMVLFEWLHQSGNALFKEVSQKFLRG